MKTARWTLASLVTASMGIGVAYALTLVLISPAHSQTGKTEAPSDGALPAEFMKQIEGGNATGSPPPPEAGAAKPGAPTPPPPLPPEGAAAPAKTPPAQPAPPPVEVAAPPPPAPPAMPAAGTAVGREEYIYDGAGRRDPFRPYRIIRQREQPVVNGKTPVKVEDTLEPLQRFETDQLQVLAILWDVRQPRALIKDPDGKIHTLVKNTKLGRNNGYVAAIREGEIVIMESFDQEGGGLAKRTRTLEFKKQGRD